MTSINLPIIGYHYSPLGQKFGIPRQPNLVQIASFIKFVPPYDVAAAFDGIEQFSHLWIVWQFHHNKPQANFRPQVRPPRYGGNAKTGVFATRSMYRPSALGLSVVKLDKVERVDDRVILHLLGADMADSTPIVDIKPYLPFVDSVPMAKSGQIDVPDVKPVHCQAGALAQLTNLQQAGTLTDKDIDHIKNLIAQDPRPAYRQAEIGSRFAMRYGAFDVWFLMDESGVMQIDQVDFADIKAD